mgnify:CR=1 FL=1
MIFLYYLRAKIFIIDRMLDKKTVFTQATPVTSASYTSHLGKSDHVCDER